MKAVSPTRELLPSSWLAFFGGRAGGCGRGWPRVCLELYAQIAKNFLLSLSIYKSNVNIDICIYSFFMNVYCSILLHSNLR